MSANMQQPPPPSMPPPPSGPPGGAGDHGPFSDEEIQRIMADTGYSYQEVCARIDQTGATTKEQLYPQVYSGQGIEPEGQTVGAGVVQGEPGAPPATAMPAEAGAPVQSAAPMNEQAAGGGAPEGIDPEIAQQMHSMLAPKYKRK